MKSFARLLPDGIAIALFALISFIYFFQPTLDGKVLMQHDSVAGIGAGEEVNKYREETGETARWTGTVFSGMPTYQIAPSYDSVKTLNLFGKVYTLYLPTYVAYIFILLLGFYILLRAFSFDTWMAALGAVVWAFSSYFFIIISAGHIWKLLTLAYIPPTIAGMIWVYRGKIWLGSLVLAFFTALQILSNHIQMTYYFLFPMAFIAIAYGVKAWQEKQWGTYWKGTLALLVAGAIGIAANISNLYHTYEYSKQSMRGKSELVKSSLPTAKASDGLEKEYITQWSYGIGETWSLLVPNVKGGASVPLSQNKVAMEKADANYVPLYDQIGQYWGEQPGTSGPVYVGAFVLFLFFLGCFVVKGPLKWALIAGTIFSITLAWGKNFMPLTDFFIDHVPMYNKFRAVSSLLVVAEFTIPLLGVLGLREVIRRRDTVLTEERTGFIISFLLTAGVSFLFAVAPGFFFSDFISSSEKMALQSLPTEHIIPITTNLIAMREAIFTADAWRSLFVVLMGCALLFAFLKGKLNERWLVGGLLLLCLGDMWSVNKRYLYDEQFVSRTEGLKVLQPTSADKMILEDHDLSYRVANLAVSTFNDNTTSYFHKSIGGYHAAKLLRYQELIDTFLQDELARSAQAIVQAQGDMTQISASDYPILNMLNTRYLILPAQGSTVPVRNPYALGNAWFVQHVTAVETANEELETMRSFDPATTAVVRKEMATQLHATADSTANVTLTAYRPDALTYEVNSVQGGAVVFSEIYYPGWTVTIDGTPATYIRANYVLRAMNVPAGKHTIVFTYHPASVTMTETIAYIALALLAIGAVFVIVRSYRKPAE